MEQEIPLIHQIASRQIKLQKIDNYVMYDPNMQKSVYMGKSTACPKGTSGTKPKDEADQVMDD